MPKKHPDPYKFERSEDGSVRIRMRFTSEEADLIEVAAQEDGLAVVPWMHDVINDACGAPLREQYAPYRKK